MRSDLPSGTVTFLFTDIEGSTRLLHTLGPEDYSEALAVHRALLRSAFAGQGGVEVDTQGDAFFVAFPTAPGAAAAAIAGQDALSVGPIRVRMGLHTGAPTLAAEGYVGVDVHRGARVAALAHGGQVLLSATTAALLDGADLLDLGSHWLKDFDGAIRLYQLGAEKHPPIRTPGTVLLPTPATSFLGRERELFEAISVLLGRDPRVFTIVGPGGTGKTRFALELVRLLSEEAEGGSIFVPLAALRDPGLVLPTLAEAVGAEAASPESIAVRVGAKRTHVLLDNLEQLLPDAARTIAGLVEAAPELRLILTSREPLRIAAETEFDLPPLAPDEAVSLFLAAAERVRANISHTVAVDRLCERLDRLPLALELAAARTKLLSPEALLERLGARVDLLRGGRDADPRHATLAATIAWSYDLLDPDEQQLFKDLAVFRGGCTLESAQAVCEADIDSLASLLDKSLLRRRTDPDETDRFWMLETIREFAMARLAESGEEDILRRRQYDSLLELTKRANTGEGITTGGPGRWHLDLVAPEVDNIRALLDWAADHAPEHGLELTTALEAFWVVREPVEGAARLERFLQATLDAPQKLRADSLRALAGVLDIVGESERAAPHYRESLALFELLDDEPNAANLRFRVAANLTNQGEGEAAAASIEESLEEFRRLGLRVGEAQALGYLGVVAARRGELASAAELFAQSAMIAREVDWPWWEIFQHMSLADCERQRGRFAKAQTHANSALQLALDIGDRMSAVFAAAELACAAVAQDNATLAGRLWGAIESEEANAPIGQWAKERESYASLILSTTGPQFEQARQQGTLLSLSEASQSTES